MEMESKSIYLLSDPPSLHKKCWELVFLILDAAFKLLYVQYIWNLKKQITYNNQTLWPQNV